MTISVRSALVYQQANKRRGYADFRAACFTCAVILFVGYKLLLGSGESDLQAILTQHRL